MSPIAAAARSRTGRRRFVIDMRLTSEGPGGIPGAIYRHRIYRRVPKFVRSWGQAWTAPVGWLCSRPHAPLQLHTVGELLQGPASPHAARDPVRARGGEAP